MAMRNETTVEWTLVDRNVGHTLLLKQTGERLTQSVWRKFRDIFKSSGSTFPTPREINIIVYASREGAIRWLIKKSKAVYGAGINVTWKPELASALLEAEKEVKRVSIEGPSPETLLGQVVMTVKAPPGWWQILDKLRDLGYMVGCHNDYVLREERYTFWLLTRAGFCVRGEGKTDAEALQKIADAIGLS